MLDIKMNDEENYKLHTGGDLSVALDYLRFLDKANKRVWIRQVIVPKINDRAEDILRLYKLVSPFSCVERIELLPFRTLCKEKYDALGMTFPLEDTPEMTESEIESLIALCLKV